MKGPLRSEGRSVTVGWFVSWPTSSQKLCYRDDIAYFAAFDEKAQYQNNPRGCREGRLSLEGTLTLGETNKMTPTHFRFRHPKMKCPSAHLTVIAAKEAGLKAAEEEKL